jgi:hypothetical protein
VSHLFKPATARRGYTRRMKNSSSGLAAIISVVIWMAVPAAQDRPSRLCQPDTRGGGARTQATIDRMAWLAGVWVGSSGPTTIEERWTPPAGGSMLAISRTIRKDGAMSAFEFLCIVERDGGLVYSAMPNGRSPATDFTLTKLDADGATFENPAHDFPKVIRYTRRDDGTLEAVVSGSSGENAERFVFKRQP